MTLTFKPQFRIALFLAPLVLGGCSALPATMSADASTVVSRSSDLKLTAADYQAALAFQPPEMLKVAASSDERLRDLALDIHSDAALARQAIAAGLDRDPAIASRLAEAQRKILSAALLYQTRDAVEEPEQLDTLLQERYSREKERLRTLEGRKVAHILLTPLKGCPCEVKPLMQRVRELHKALLAGDDFAEAARKWSIDGTSEKGGVLPDPIRRDNKTVLAFQDAVFAMEKPGDISEPIQTEYGVHIIKLLDIEPSRQLTYEEVKDKLRAQTVQEMRFSAMEALRGAAYPDPTQINYAALRTAIKELLPQPAAAPAVPASETVPAAEPSAPEQAPPAEPAPEASAVKGG